MVSAGKTQIVSTDSLECLHVDDGPEDHHDRVVLVRSSGAITHGQDEARDETYAVEPLKGNAQDVTYVTKECWVGQTACQDLEDQEEVANSKPGKELVDGLVDELDEEHDLADEGVVGAEELVEVRDGVHGREERAVQPTTPLTDQLRHLRVTPIKLRITVNVRRH